MGRRLDKLCGQAPLPVGSKGKIHIVHGACIEAAAQMPRYQEVEKDVTKSEAKKILANKAKLSKETITYLDSYRYGDDLIIKLAKAMEN